MRSFEDAAEELANGHGYGYLARTFEHEDGSLTFVFNDDDPEHANPRDNDGNVASLVMQHRDYMDLDERHNSIEYAADQWGIEDERTARYVAMFCDEVVAFEPRWQVSGSSQSDWAYGYAYVLRSDWDDAFPGVEPAVGYTYTDTSTGRRETITPATCIQQEVEVYGQYFAGEVYGYVHITPGDIIVETDIDGERATCRHCGRTITTDEDGRWIDPEATGDDSLWRETCDENNEDRIAAHEPTRTLAPHGYVTGDGKGGWREFQTDEASCWGFLGHDSLKDIAAEASSSPVVGER